VVVAPDLEAAISLKKRLDAVCVVTEQGEVITPAGVWVGGGGDENLSDLLSKKREIRTMAEQVKTLSASLAETRRLRDETEAGIRELEADLQKQTMRRTELTEKKTKRENDLFRSRETERLEASRLESIREELDGIEEEVDAADGILRESTEIVDETTREIDELKKRSAQFATEVEKLTTDAKAAETDIVEDRLVLTRALAGKENAESALKRLSAYRTEADRRKAAVAEEIRAKTEKLDIIRKEIEADERTRRQTTEKLNRRITEEEKQASEFAEVDAALKAHDDEMGTIRTKRDSLVQKIRVLEVELSRFRIQRDNVISQISDRRRRPFAELRREMDCGDEDENTPTEVLSAELFALQKKLDRLGPVNPDAVGEYEALTERREFLCGQRSDLEQAIEDLQKVIRKINKITRTRFLETVSEVNEKLSEVFPRLFEGGTAELVLTEPDAPLETGVEYMIRPPGKKLTRQSLLSGGEKALCAIAFVFSIFLIKPASFCIMDEIDAPLDEANVLRFNKLLKLIGEKSQIIMITHQKRTMEFADRLYGVTMETKGISKVVSVNLQQGEGEAATARRAADG
jgi:chromosome segregation protein